MVIVRRLVPQPSPAHGRRHARVRVLAASLAGGAAGLAAGAACVAWPMQGGPALPPSRALAPPAGERPPAVAAQGVAAVLAPAGQSDVPPRERRDEAEAP